MEIQNLEAVNENTSAERLWELARVSTSLARIVAKNPSAEPELLRVLASSSDSAISVGVASNPNTPTEVLLELGEEFPEQLLDNPVFELLLLENPNLVQQMPLSTLRSILMLDRVPESFLKQAEIRLNLWAVSWEEHLILEVLAHHPKTPASVLERLAQGTQGRWLGKYIVKHPNTSESFLEQLAGEQNVEIRRGVARNPNTPASVLEKLAEDRTPYGIGIYIPSDVAQNPNAPLSVLELLARDKNRRVRAHLAEHPNIPGSVVEQLVTDWETHKYLVQNLNILKSALTDLAEHQNMQVRALVAKHPNTCVKILKQWAGDKTYYSGLAQNPSTPVEVLEMIAKQSRCGIYLAQNPSTPESVLEQLAGDEDDWVRYRVAENPNMPGKVLEQLAKAFHYCFNFRWQVAKHPNTPVSVLAELAGADNPLVRQAVARNPKISVYFLAQLAEDRDEQVRQAVAENPSTPTYLLEQLAGDEHHGVRENVARNLSTPDHLLTQLAMDTCQSREVSQAAVYNPNIPLRILEQLAARYDNYRVGNDAARQLNVRIIQRLTSSK